LVAAAATANEPIPVLVAVEAPIFTTARENDTHG
jgi:hypothetical protein